MPLIDTLQKQYESLHYEVSRGLLEDDFSAYLSVLKPADMKRLVQVEIMFYFIDMLGTVLCEHKVYIHDIELAITNSKQF